MAEVVLIPTGKLEHAALGPALLRLFPGHVFRVRPDNAPQDGFTSSDVKHLAKGSASPANIDKLAALLVGAVVPGKGNKPADYAHVVEDLELVNDHQPELVVQVFRDAVARHIDSNWPSLNTRQRVYATVRERCSFHLFRPMPEAYFFGEPAALQRAGAVQSAQLPEVVDLEQFRTIDSGFLQLPPDTRPKSTRRVIDMPDRERHPKSYLHYLCDPTLVDKKRRYQETKGGVAALTTLAWQDVMTPSPYCPFLHALLDDLAFALQQPLAFIDSQHADPLTRIPGSANALLRNV